MSKDNEILVIRIARTTVGISSPFDKLYFITRDMRGVVPSLFSYALILPITDELRSVLKKEEPTKWTLRKFNRDDANSIREVPPSEVNARNTWWEEVFEEYNFDERVVAIPILTKQQSSKVLPRYLGSKKWFDTQEKKFRRNRPQKFKPTIPDLAYLATPHPAPHDKIRPICSICPRALLQLQGECVPGQLICYTSLNLKVFEEGEDTSASVCNDDSGVD